MLTDLLKEFREFILRGNAIDLAVAVVLGAAFGAVVNSLVQNLLTPIVAMIFGEPNFNGMAFTINGAQFGYGAFITDVITFLTVGAAIFFFVVKPVNVLMARRRAGEEPPPEAVPEDIVLLSEIRDLLKTGRAA
jgi:large conductance mechanosensitive channel